MYLYTCFFLHLCNGFSSIKYRKSRSVISPLKIESGFNNRGFFVMPFNSHCPKGTVKQLEFILEVLIHIAKKGVMGRACIYKKTQVL